MLSPLKYYKLKAISTANSLKLLINHRIKGIILILEGVLKQKASGKENICYIKMGF
jgi:hypothetical protein